MALDPEENQLPEKEDYSWEEGADHESEDGQDRESLGSSQIQAALSERRSLGHLWLISYADFMTILMIFFLVMYGYAVLAKTAIMKSKGIKLTYSEFSEKMTRLKDQLGDQMQMEEDINKVVLQLSDKVLFARGQAALNSEAIGTLEELSNSLKLVDGDVVVEGHTDNIPIVGGRFK